MTEIGITVAICTRNRAGLLSRCLEALARADKPANPFEVVVVANACSDDTLEVAKGFAGRLQIVVEEEPIPGVSLARNRLLDLVRGRWIVWIDDDAMARSDLLTAYERAITTSPSCAIFGGTILPVLEGNPPAWLLDGLHVVENAYAAHRPEAPTTFGDPGSNVPFGANYAMRSDVQRAFTFDPRLGRRPEDPMWGGEETMSIRGALAAGHQGRWVPDAVVDHIIGPERQTEAWLWRYYHADGRLWSPDKGKSLSRWFKAVRAYFRYRRARHRAAPAEWLALLVRAASLAGRAGVRPEL